MSKPEGFENVNEGRMVVNDELFIMIFLSAMDGWMDGLLRLE